MTLQHSERMIQPLRREVCGMGIRFGLVVAEEDLAPVDCDVRPPFAVGLVPTCAQEAASPQGSSLVLQVLALGCLAEIRESVIRRVTRNVVQAGRRPSPVNVQPSQTVRFVQTAIDADSDVAASIFVARNGFRLPTTGRYKPRERPGDGVVLKQFAQACCGKIGGSHDALQKLIGQMPASVFTTARASAF